jgi:hypothetical protein
MLCYLVASAPLSSYSRVFSVADAVRLGDTPATLPGLRSGGEPAVHSAATVHGLTKALVPHRRSIAACPVPPPPGAALEAFPLGRGPPQR